MSRFTTAGGGTGTPGPQGPTGPAGADANTADFTFAESTMSTNGDMDISVLGVPGEINLSAYAGVNIQTSADFGLTANKIITTSNGATDNMKIGDDAWIGDGNIANNIVIVGQQDSLNGGIVLGERLTESVSTDGSNLSLNADNDVILNPGSSYAYLGTPTVGGETRIAQRGFFGEVDRDILPVTDNAYTLGNSTHRWKSISIGEGTIYVTDATTGDQAAITVDNGIFLVDGIAQAQLPDLAVTNLTFSDNTVQTTAATTISAPTTYNPVFSATGLTYTGTPATGSYMKIGKMVTFRIHVNFATVTNFGTGKYSLTLPFAPASHYMFRDGGLHHTDTNPDDHYQIAGDADPGSTTISLYYSSGAQDLAMDKNSPHAIHTNDYMYISGTYETV